MLEVSELMVVTWQPMMMVFVVAVEMVTFDKAGSFGVMMAAVVAFAACEAAAFVASDNTVVVAAAAVAAAAVVRETMGSLVAEKETQEVGTLVAVPSFEAAETQPAKAYRGCWRSSLQTDQRGPLDHSSFFALAFLSLLLIGSLCCRRHRHHGGASEL